MVYFAVPIGKSGKYTLVNKEALPLFDSHRWSVQTLRDSGRPYPYVWGTRRTCWGSKLRHPKERLHRLIVGAQKGQIVDHANGDTLDNRAENLRICSHAENMRNRRLQKNKTGYPGVYQARDKFVACVVVDGVRHRQRFDSPKEAHFAYLEMKKRLHGEFAGY